MRSTSFRGFVRFRRVILAAGCGVAALLAGVASVEARPSAMKLFPEETLLLVRTPNLGEMLDRLRETSTGRMVRDPQLAPFIERLYGSAGDIYTQRVAEWLGVSWEELKNLPRAEFAFAIVARKDLEPAFLLLVDQGEGESVARRLLDSALERIKERGGETRPREQDGGEDEAAAPPGAPPPPAPALAPSCDPVRGARRRGIPLLAPDRDVRRDTQRSRSAGARGRAPPD